MHTMAKKHFSLITNALFYLGLWLLLSLVTSNSFAKDKIEIDEQAVKDLQETVIEIQFQIKESIAKITDIQQTLRPLRLNVTNHDKSIRKNATNITTLDSTLEDVKQKLTDIYKRLDTNDGDIKLNRRAINKLNEKLLVKAREIRANASDLLAQKTLIEDNSIRLYEILIKSDHLSSEVKKIDESLKEIEQVDSKQELKDEINISINQLWHLFATILVFFAPLAFVLSRRFNDFKPLADGVEQHQGIILVTLGVFLGYFTVGFGLMYGSSNGGWIGMSSYLINTSTTEANLQPNILLTEFMLYQIGFSLLASMIVYTAVGRQLSSVKHLFLAIFVAAVLIPIFGHWVWAGHFLVDNQGWLESKGFVDQGGAIIANTISVTFSLFIVIKLSKSYPPPAKINPNDHEPVYSSSAVLLLWLAWLGFTTANLPIGDGQIANVILNVGLAGSTGGLTSYLHSRLFDREENSIIQETGGFVTGLVAITACAQNVTHLEAIAIGASAGLLQNISYHFLQKYILQFQWQRKTASLVAIHGMGGIWGGLCVAIFTTDGDFSSPNIPQLMIQFMGIGIAIAYSFFMAKIMLFFLKPRKQAEKVTS